MVAVNAVYYVASVWVLRADIAVGVDGGLTALEKLYLPYGSLKREIVGECLACGICIPCV